MNLLISNPSFSRFMWHLPYLWGRIREYCDLQDSRDFSGVNFLDPIFEGPSTKEKGIDKAQEVDWKGVDVLFLSCYVWNWEYNLELAKTARRMNPKIVIIAGGPQALYKPWQKVELFYDCDYVTSYEGEKISAEILYRLLNGISIHDVEGLVDPRNPREIKQQRLELTNFKSPYILYKKDYLRFCQYMRKNGKAIGAIWETNRGCPYKCTFCDWGATTNSKIKTYDKEVVFKELEFLLGTLKISFLMNTDANFGILPQDIEYAKKIAEYKNKYGNPGRGVYVSPAKNNVDRVNEVLKILHSANLLEFVQLSYQHTDQEVLTAIKRENIDIEKFVTYMHESYRMGVPLQGTVILGNPGDTYDKWTKNLCEMLERRFHDLRIHNFQLLPNSPASDPEYMEQWQIKTVKSKYSNVEFGIMKEDVESSFDAYYVCSTKTYTLKDWIEMQAFSSMILGMETLNLTKYFTLFLRYYYNISYLDLYNTIKEVPMVKQAYDEVKKAVEQWIEFGGYKSIDYKGVKYSFDAYFKIKLYSEDSLFYEQLSDTFQSKYPIMDPTILKDIIRYQAISVLDWRPVKQLSFEYDIHSVIEKLKNLPPMETVNNLYAEQIPNTIIAENKFQLTEYNNKWKIPNSYKEWLVSDLHGSIGLRYLNNTATMKRIT